MVGAGIWEIVLVFGVLAGGGGNVDIVSTLPAKQYFLARDIEVSADKLMELATETPDSSKKLFAQLMALSHLAAEPELIAKSPKAVDYRKSLVEIAGGRKAADPQGFSADYAQKALRALSGEKPPVAAKRSWKDGIKFLPDQASMVGYIDMGGGSALGPKNPMIGTMLEVMPKEAKEQMWSALEKVGNIQIESLGFTTTIDPDSGRVSDFVVRATGRGNPDWILPLLTELKENKDKERGDVGGQKVRFFDSGPGMPAVALIGSREVIIAGSPPEFPGKQGVKKAKRQGSEIIEQLLASRGKSGGPIQGNLKADLAVIPAEATSLYVGNLPPENGPTPFPMPRKMIAFGKPFAGGIDLLVTAIMTDETAANDFIAQAGKIRDMGLQELKKAQGQPLPIPGINLGGMISLLESIELNSDKNEAKIRALVPEESMSMMMMGFMIPFQMRAAAPPPAPPQAVPAPVKVPEKK